MGLWDKLFHRDCQYYLNKCDEMITKQDFGEAMACVKKAMALAATQEEKDVAEAKKKELTHLIYQRAYDNAKKYLKVGNTNAAQNAFDLAARHAQTDEERDALNALKEEDYEKEAEDKLEDVRQDVERIEDNYNRLSFIMYLFAIPTRKSKKEKYIKASNILTDYFEKTGHDMDAVLKEDEDVLKHLKAELKRLSKEK
jgi:hypothetical protein